MEVMAETILCLIPTMKDKTILNWPELKKMYNFLLGDE